MLKGEARPPQSPLKDMKYVVVSGGVLSGLGKGVTASSIGVLLKSAGLRVTAVKIDPYLNSDAGTMSPFEHGEVFVLDDGGESDLDLVSRYFATVHVWQAGRFEISNYSNLVHTFCISLTGQLRALS